MLEIPEATTVARQMNESVKGKKIKNAVAGASPHKFAWYFGDPAEYGPFLRGRTLGETFAYGGLVETGAEGAVLRFGDGAVLRYFGPDEAPPPKHQLLIEFEDGSALMGTVAMYGGLWAHPAGAMDDNAFYMAAKNAVPPLGDEFDYKYFLSLLGDSTRKLGAKAFLATEQRIPGLGNGVLQDILLNARVHPKTKMNTLSEERVKTLFDCVKSTLADMTRQGGRDTERGLYGEPGGYKTMLSKNNKAMLCPVCGGPVTKQSYMGGSVYFCGNCQKV
jgi:formamidopyrimidine-DNA glycosylase